MLQPYYFQSRIILHQNDVVYNLILWIWNHVCPLDQAQPLQNYQRLERQDVEMHLPELKTSIVSWVALQVKPTTRNHSSVGLSQQQITLRYVCNEKLQAHDNGAWPSIAEPTITPRGWYLFVGRKVLTWSEIQHWVICPNLKNVIWM